MSYPRGTLIRNTTAARINHWITAACFVLLMLSGLSMFHPLLFFLSALFGGGQWTRAIHPWIGIVLLVSYAGLIVQFWRDNFWNRDDIAWMRAIVRVLRERGGRRSRSRRASTPGRNSSSGRWRCWCRCCSSPASSSGRSISRATPRSRQQRIAVLIHSSGGDRGDHRLDHPRLRRDLGQRLGAGDDAGLCDARLGVAASPQMAAGPGRRPARLGRVRVAAGEGS